MKYLAEQKPPAVPEAMKPRLIAALREAHEAHVAIVRNEDVPEEVLDLVQSMHDALERFAEIYRDDLEFERWWSHHLYFKLYGEHLDAPTPKEPDAIPKGEVIDFAEILRRAQEHNEA